MSLFSLGGDGGQDVGRLAHRLGVIERKLDMILKHLGIDVEQGPQSDLERQVADLIRAGRKIEAIKLYREYTSVGLKEAKDAVEAIAG